MKTVRGGVGAASLLLIATACGSGGEEVSPPSVASWLCKPNERTVSAVDPVEPPDDRTLADAVALRLEPPYNILERQRTAALVQTHADDSVTGEYRFGRWETSGGWYMETAEECK